MSGLPPPGIGQFAMTLSVAKSRPRVAEIQPPARFGHDDGRFAVGREIHVVGVVHGNGLRRLAGERIDRRRAGKFSHGGIGAGVGALAMALQ